MTAQLKQNPLADGGSSQQSAIPSFGSKRDVARLLGMSVRTVDNLLAAGMPHLRLGARRVRFDIPEVAAWLRAKYRVQRRRTAPTPAGQEVAQ